MWRLVLALCAALIALGSKAEATTTFNDGAAEIDYSFSGEAPFSFSSEDTFNVDIPPDYDGDYSFLVTGSITGESETYHMVLASVSVSDSIPGSWLFYMSQTTCPYNDTCSQEPSVLHTGIYFVTPPSTLTVYVSGGATLNDGIDDIPGAATVNYDFQISPEGGITLTPTPLPPAMPLFAAPIIAVTGLSRLMQKRRRIVI